MIFPTEQSVLRNLRLPNFSQTSPQNQSNTRQTPGVCLGLLGLVSIPTAFRSAIPRKTPGICLVFPGGEAGAGPWPRGIVKSNRQVCRFAMRAWTKNQEKPMRLPGFYLRCRKSTGVCLVFSYILCESTASTASLILGRQKVFTAPSAQGAVGWSGKGVFWGIFPGISRAGGAESEL